VVVLGVYRAVRRSIMKIDLVVILVTHVTADPSGTKETWGSREGMSGSRPELLLINTFLAFGVQKETTDCQIRSAKQQFLHRCASIPQFKAPGLLKTTVQRVYRYPCRTSMPHSLQILINRYVPVWYSSSTKVLSERGH
jgi:hypothetical protein